MRLRNCPVSLSWHFPLSRNFSLNLQNKGEKPLQPVPQSSSFCPGCSCGNPDKSSYFYNISSISGKTFKLEASESHWVGQLMSSLGTWHLLLCSLAAFIQYFLEYCVKFSPVVPSSWSFCIYWLCVVWESIPSCWTAQTTCRHIVEQWHWRWALSPALIQTTFWNWWSPWASEPDAVIHSDFTDYCTASCCLPLANAGSSLYLLQMLRETLMFVRSLV